MAYAHQIDYAQRVIDIRGLYKSFGPLKVLQGVDLDVFKGENVVVLGRSGTGKSVLIKIIAGLLPPDAGTVNVLGRHVSELSEEELRMLRLKLGFSFQNSALYDSMSIRENLEFPVSRNMPGMSKTALDDLVKETLDAVGLLNKIDRMPSELSGGQRKRIGIARTLMLKPEIMLYDEPTAGLDPVTSVEINNLINEVQERYNTSAIIITHDLACAKATGDRLVMLFEGKVAKAGSFKEVFASDDPEVQKFYNYNFIQ
ncbi:MAG: ATP-binding cassette domain-containing protein [Saprospiraceae bacterium]|nr:ATP-binding cassette domain-containing protein [Saprospiraceae bacterium]